MVYNFFYFLYLGLAYNDYDRQTCLKILSLFCLVFTCWGLVFICSDDRHDDGRSIFRKAASLIILVHGATNLLYSTTLGNLFIKHKAYHYFRTQINKPNGKLILELVNGNLREPISVTANLVLFWIWKIWKMLIF